MCLSCPRGQHITHRLDFYVPIRKRETRDEANVREHLAELRIHGAKQDTIDLYRLCNLPGWAWSQAPLRLQNNEVVL